MWKQREKHGKRYITRCRGFTVNEYDYYSLIVYNSLIRYNSLETIANSQSYSVNGPESVYHIPRNV